LPANIEYSLVEVKNTIAFTACALVCGFVVVLVKSTQNTNKKLKQKMKN
jgi:hypothetical protein